ncbi:UNVERIFIED_CONTAM: hypothetical protein Sindi_2343000 [Sesamum indicum]
MNCVKRSPHFRIRGVAPPFCRRPTAFRCRRNTIGTASSWHSFLSGQFSPSETLKRRPQQRLKWALPSLIGLTLVDSGLTELTRSTQPVSVQKQQPSQYPTQKPSERTFAEVVPPSQASKTAQKASHKYFLADSPPPSVGAVFTDEKGPILVFTDAETESLAAPFRLALVTISTLALPHCRTWSQRIWHIQGFPMRVFKWTPTFTTAQESSTIPIWNALFAVANMIGTPLQIDVCTFNQSNLSKARVGIEIDLTKPLVEKVEYEQVQKHCNLCKHVGHDSLERYTMGNAPLPPPRANQSKGKEKMATEEQPVPETAKAFERGECSKSVPTSRYSTNHFNDNVDSGKHGNDNVEIKTSDDNCSSKVETDLHVEDNICTAHDDNHDIENIAKCDEMDESIPDVCCDSNNPVVCDKYFPTGGMEMQSVDKIRLEGQRRKNQIKLFKILSHFGVVAGELKAWDDTDESQGEDDVTPPNHLHQQTARCRLHRSSDARKFFRRVTEHAHHRPTPIPNHGMRVPRNVLTRRQSPPKISEISPKLHQFRRDLLFRNSPPSLKIVGHHIHRLIPFSMANKSPLRISNFGNHIDWAFKLNGKVLSRQFSGDQTNHGRGPLWVDSSRSCDSKETNFFHFHQVGA